MSDPALLPPELQPHVVSTDPLVFSSAEIQSHVDALLAQIPEGASEVKLQVGFGPGGPGFYEAGVLRLGDVWSVEEGAGWNRVDGFQAQLGVTARFK